MSDSRTIHDETASGWDIVAESKYQNEFEEDLSFLRTGKSNLLPPEKEHLDPIISGKHVVQLQCSHGLDALGILNAGAKSIVGVDISEEMIKLAREKALVLESVNAEFIHSDAINAPDELNGTADIVYTGRGSLIWIMNIAAWASTVKRILKPGGLLFVYEGHPLTALWDRNSENLKLLEDVGYFQESAREYEGFPSSQVENVVGQERPKMLERQWRPGEIIDALIAEGMKITKFQEYSDLFWNQFPEWNSELAASLPNSYVLMAEK